MHRNWKTIRNLLRFVADDPQNNLCFFKQYSGLYYHHSILIEEAGFATVFRGTGDEGMDWIRIDTLSAAGKEFLELSCDRDVWDRAMEIADENSGISHDVLVALLQKLSTGGLNVNYPVRNL